MSRPEKHDISLSYDYIDHINKQMVSIYDKGGLSDDEKAHLAKLMKRMMSVCDTRRSGLFTLKEQTDYLNSLTEDERNQIEHQVQMYLDCRIFYRDFIYQELIGGIIMNRRIISYLLVLCLMLTMSGEAFATSTSRGKAGKVGGSLIESRKKKTEQTEITEEYFIGKWMLTSVTAEGMTLPAFLIGMSLSFNIQTEKTTMEGSFDGEDELGEVDSYFNGTNMVVIMKNGESLVLEYEDSNRISSKVDGMTLHFEKDETATETSDIGTDEVKKLSDVSETDFYGYWIATHTAYDGIKLPIAFLGANMSLAISQGKAIFEIDEGSSSEEIEAPTKLSGDVLIVNIPDMFFAVNLYSDGTASFELDGIEVYLKREGASDSEEEYSIGNTLKMSDYTYDEFIMYYTMTLGYGATLDALKNPKSAEFMGIAYDPVSQVAYFCVLAENDFGGKTKSYVSYGYNSQALHESDDLKYYYDSAPIHRTMTDLQVFMDISKTADESEVPVDDTAEKLAGYSKNEQTMYANFIEGYDSLTLLYDDVVVLKYKYNSDDDTAYFKFFGYEVGDLVSTYARYNEELGFDAHDAFEQQFNNADISVSSFEIDKYKEAIAPRITK